MLYPTRKPMINAVDGADMIWIPEGEFITGSSDADIAAILQRHHDWDANWFAHEKPQHPVTLPGFWIYTHPVTVAQYRTFCTATGREMPDAPDWGWVETHPIVNVTWQDVKDYAAWAHAAIPTEYQWEKAARGTDGRCWPWGNVWEPERCAYTANSTSTVVVGSYPGGASPYGVMDMAGNVWEWCLAAPVGDYISLPHRYPPQRHSPTPSGYVLRGGAWSCAFDDYLRCAYRCFQCDTQRGHGPYIRPTNGFRCVVNAE